ncbi:MAG TPA: serine/threonine-protein kinase, partial [Pirellulales bacterium]
MTFHPAENSEPIPGYLLSERIGIGGYGEVWKVRAPGGLTKAIKFVYGRLDDDRGARELKALGRIKEVRHPFLLSLERFDVVDGQLYIVTELAEMSLMDRFRQCREAGQPGIPRDELLAYLRDAADALDYMSEKYGLQHLDIKPENLLLVGGRVKVADFGLVKDLQDTNCTTIGGVTPLYATPEAFDGKASRQSDQYSLAIVYQEMLTGVLPFPGVTTAQLAAQHLHSPPLLAALGEQDREIVARALAKQPEARFASCRELVDRLLAGPAAHRQPIAEPADLLDNEQQRATIALRATPCAHLDETI